MINMLQYWQIVLKDWKFNFGTQIDRREYGIVIILEYNYTRDTIWYFWFLCCNDYKVESDSYFTFIVWYTILLWVSVMVFENEK